MNNKLKIGIAGVGAAIAMYATNVDAQTAIKVQGTKAPAAGAVANGEPMVPASQFKQKVEEARQEGADSKVCPPGETKTIIQQVEVPVETPHRGRTGPRRNINACEQIILTTPGNENNYGVCATDDGRAALRRLGLNVGETIVASKYTHLNSRYAPCPGESICTVVGTESFRNVNALLGGRLNDALQNGTVNEGLLRRIMKEEIALGLARDVTPTNLPDDVTPVYLAADASAITVGTEFLFNGDGNTLAVAKVGYELGWKNFTANVEAGYMFLFGPKNKNTSRLVGYDFTQLALGTQILEDSVTDTSLQGAHLPFAGLNLGGKYDVGDVFALSARAGYFAALSQEGNGVSETYHMHKPANPNLATEEKRTPLTVEQSWHLRHGFNAAAGVSAKVTDRFSTTFELITRCLGTNIGRGCYGGAGVGVKGEF